MSAIAKGVLAATLAGGLMAAPVGVANAGPMAVTPPQVVQPDNSSITLVRYVRHFRGRVRHYRGNPGVAAALGVFGSILGAAIANSQANDYYYDYPGYYPSYGYGYGPGYRSFRGRAGWRGGHPGFVGRSFGGGRGGFGGGAVGHGGGAVAHGGSFAGKR